MFLRSINLSHRILFILGVALCPLMLMGQQNISFRDSVDGKLDMSDWVLEAHGFIPIPVLITEPALGDIGGALIPVFITRNEPYIDTVGQKVVVERVRPNLYGAAGAYTANGTWLVGAAASGTIRAWRAQYRLATGYADVNLEFYRERPNDETYSFEFNIQTTPIFGQLLKQLKRGSHWYAGLNYLFLKTELKRTNTEFHTPDDVEAIISRVVMVVDYDQRYNIFTPDKGFRINLSYSISDEFMGSDYDYTMTSDAMFGYMPVGKKLIAAIRADYQQVWGDAPFYLLPFINMRGIPVARYQGKITTLVETEWRFDFASRWSMVAFGGAGKAIGEWSDFSDSDFRASGGLGGRYLLARKLKLRMGLDIAHGPEDFAYYMVFGTSWVK